MLNLRFPTKKALISFSLGLVVVACIAIMGCQGALDRITPVPVIRGAEEYSDFQVQEWEGWTTLYQAKLQIEAMITKHIETQIDLGRKIDDDERDFTRLKDRADINVRNAQDWQDVLVGTLGNEFPLVGLLGSSLLAGMVGQAIGTRKKRPGDLDPIEVENEKKKAVAEAITLNVGNATLTVGTGRSDKED